MKFNKEANRGRANCTRTDCTFTCTTRHGSYNLEDEDGPGKLASCWGVCVFHPHSCLFSWEEKDGNNYPANVDARILLKEVRNLQYYTQDLHTTFLYPYFHRRTTYNYVFRVREELRKLLYGQEQSRIQLLPDVVEKIKEAGHFCEFKFIAGEEMKRIAIKKGGADHNLKYNHCEVKPQFDPSQVDVSDIKMNRRYFYSSTLALSTSMMQSYFLNDANGEIDFATARAN